MSCAKCGGFMWLDDDRTGGGLMWVCLCCGKRVYVTPAATDAPRQTTGRPAGSRARKERAA